MKFMLVAAAMTLGTAAVAQTTSTTTERDSRGIPVVSAPATAPSGSNMAAPANNSGQPATVNPNQAQVFASRPAAQEYPPCTREMTDGCVQTYERGRAPR
jgi:hypothetical protein